MRADAETSRELPPGTATKGQGAVKVLLVSRPANRFRHAGALALAKLRQHREQASEDNRTCGKQGGSRASEKFAVLLLRFGFSASIRCESCKRARHFHRQGGTFWQATLAGPLGSRHCARTRESLQLRNNSAHAARSGLSSTRRRSTTIRAGK